MESRILTLNLESGVLNLEFGILNLESRQNSSIGASPMKYKRFEDLPVWNTAIDLAVAIYALTSKPEFAPHPGLRDQVERAAVSVSNNIAEGFERGTNNELLMFLYISRGSAGEVRSCFVCSNACRCPANWLRRLEPQNSRRKVVRDN